MKLVARSVQQLPSASTAGQCKITLGANKPVVDLSTLFSELSNTDNQQQGFLTRFYGSNENISILASSKSRMKKKTNSFFILKIFIILIFYLKKNIVFKVNHFQVYGFLLIYLLKD